MNSRRKFTLSIPDHIVRISLIMVPYFWFIFLLVTPSPATGVELTEEEKIWLEAHPEFLVAEAPVFEPLLIEQPDGSLHGIVPDTFNLIGKKLGIRFRYLSDNWSSILDKAQSQKVDIIGAMNKNTAAQLGLHTVQSPINLSTVVFANKSRPTEFTDEESIALLRVAYHHENRYIRRYVEKNITKENLVPMGSPLEAMNALVSGKVDIVIGMNIDSYLLIKNSIVEVEPIHVLADIAPQSVIAIRKDYPVLAEILRKTVAEISLKESEQILSRWTWTKVSKKPEINFTEAEKQYLEKTPTLRVQALNNFPPFNFDVNGTPKGYTIDYMNLLGEIIGKPIEYISNKPWLEYLKMLRNDQLDIIPHIAVTEERLKFIDFTPFIHIEFTSALAVNNRLDITSMSDLHGKVIAVASKTFLHSYMVKNYPHQSLLITPTTYDATEAVASGKADAVIGSLPSLNYYIQKYWFTNMSVVQIDGFQLPNKTQLPMGVAKGNNLLSSILTKADEKISYAQKLSLKQKWADQTPSKNTLVDITPKEKKYLIDKKTLNMCVDPNWMPMEALKDGLHTGISADFMSQFRQLLNIPVNIYPTNNWSASLQASQHGHCDFFPLLIKKPEKANHLTFTEPYITTPLVLVTKVETPYVNDVNSLTKVKVGITKSHMYNNALQSRFPQIEFVQVENTTDGLDRVSNGSLFAYTDTLISAGYWIQNDYLGNLKVSGELGEPLSLRVGVQKDQPLLKSIFDKAINRVTPEKRKEIVNRWIAIQYQNGIEWKTTLLSILCIIALFSIVILWYVRINKKLRSEVNQRQKAEHNALLLAKTDQLTGLLNRHGCESLFDVQMQHRRDYGTPVSMMLVDIDHFKMVNDNYGHKIGDEVLRLVSHILRTTTRESDHKVRWGGEEFLILVSDTGIERTKVFAEKLRTTIDNMRLPELPHVTVSIGIAEFEPDQCFNQWYETADKALYQAKELGRNRVCPGHSEHDDNTRPLKPVPSDTVAVEV